MLTKRLGVDYEESTGIGVFSFHGPTAILLSFVERNNKIVLHTKERDIIRIINRILHSL